MHWSYSATCLCTQTYTEAGEIVPPEAFTLGRALELMKISNSSVEIPPELQAALVIDGTSHCSLLCCGIALPHVAAIDFVL